MRARIGRVEVGEGLPVRLMGVINVSPESFYKGSVRRSPEEVARAASEMEEQGADVIDVGAMSSAPYLETWIDEETEAERIKWALKAIRDATDLPVSVDSFRPRPVLEALRMGAEAVNDVYGLAHLKPVLREIAESGAALVLMARDVESGDVIEGIIRRLRASVEAALDAGIEEERILIDPGIGFHRNHRDLKWYQVDLEILRRLREIRALGRPVLVGCSRKSFIGKLTGREDPEQPLYGSIASEAIAVLQGADVVRTHNVRETLDAVRMASALIGRPVRG